MIANFFQDCFRIVCFCFFLGLVFHRLITKFFPDLLLMYQKHKKNIAEKIKTQEKMIKQKKEILAQIEKQNEEGKRLKEKIIIWAKQQDLLIKNELEQQELSQEKLRLYMIEQSRYLALDTVRSGLMPEIMTHLKEEAHRKYTSSSEQKKYVQNIITNLERESDEQQK